MLGRVIDDFKRSARTALKLTSLAAIVATTLFIAVLFLCGAAFIAVLQAYGAVEACLTGAAIFLLMGLIAAGLYLARKNQARARAAERSKATLHTALSDPLLLVAGIRAMRAIGVKRLIPILAIGGLALSFFASRSASADVTPAE